MKIISVFNNKGGVGKTTLTYHIAQSMCEMGYKVLMIDGDPQCNLTIYSLGQDYIQSLWAEEDDFIDSVLTLPRGNSAPNNSKTLPINLEVFIISYSLLKKVQENMRYCLLL